CYHYSCPSYSGSARPPANSPEQPMRVIPLLISLTLIVGTVKAEESSPDVKAAIDKGLAFLAKEGTAWKTDRKCSSCHQVPMALWSLSEAKNLGYAVDERAITELTQWVVAQDDPAKVFPKPPPKAEGPKTDAPKTEEPKTDAPKTETPKAE